MKNTDSNSDFMYDQSAVIPWRMDGEKIKVLLVTSRDTGRWIVPKGWIESDMSARKSAAKEAWEEAGVTGKLGKKSVGDYTYSKDGKKCRVDVYLLNVTEIAKKWPEKHQRTRAWLSIKKAVAAVREEELQEIIKALPKKLKKLKKAA